MAKGDIVLIIFPFTDLGGKKLRPAVIIGETTQDVTVCFITTQTEWQESTDILLTPTINNGLHKVSLIRVGKIATLDQTMIKGLMGRLTASEILDLNTKIKVAFQLD